MCLGVVPIGTSSLTAVGYSRCIRNFLSGALAICGYPGIILCGRAGFVMRAKVMIGYLHVRFSSFPCVEDLRDLGT